MKSFMIHLTTITIAILFNSLLFGQQDIAMYINNNGNIGIGTTNPNIQGHSLSRKVVTIVGKQDGSVIEMGSDNPQNGIGIGRINFYNGTNPVTSLQIDSNPGSNNTGNFQIFTDNGSGLTPRFFISSKGDIGIGTTNPTSPLGFEGSLLHIQNSSNPATIILDGASPSGGVIELPGNIPFRIYTNNNERFRILGNGNVGIGTSNPDHPLQMASGAHVTSGGVWVNSSSKKFKENIRELSEEEAVDAIQGLIPKKFNYKTEREEYIGFIAEEVPDLVATKDRMGLSTMDIVAVLTKVVQYQQKKLEELESKINDINR